MKHVSFSDVSSSVSRGSFLVDVQGINVKGTTNNSIAVNFAVGKQTSVWHFVSQPHIVIQKLGFNQIYLLKVNLPQKIRQLTFQA